MRQPLLARTTGAFAVVALTLSVGLIGSASGSTGAVPFTDPSQNGLLTLCNAQGQRVTSGSLSSDPFVAKAVSSTPAPAGYGSGLATLYAYQPIRYEDPGDWSSYQLSGSTYFSNPSHPGATFTKLDNPLISFVGAYPLHWDGLMQLRFTYTAYETEAYPGGYPAAVLRVTGNRWRAVQEGNTPCNSTKTKSVETIVLKKSQINPGAKGHNGTGGKTDKGAGASRGKGSGSGSHSSTSPGQGGSAASSPVADASGTSGGSSSGSGTKLAVGLGVIVVLTAVGGWFAWRRRA